MFESWLIILDNMYWISKNPIFISAAWYLCHVSILLLISEKNWLFMTLFPLNGQIYCLSIPSTRCSLFRNDLYFCFYRSVLNSNLIRLMDLYNPISVKMFGGRGVGVENIWIKCIIESWRFIYLSNNPIQYTRIV